MWEWLGEPLAADFANTIRRQAAQDVDFLRSPADLAEWARRQEGRVPLVDVWARDPRPSFVAVRDLRDAVKALLHATVAGERAPAAAVDRVNAAARAVPVAPQLSGGEGRLEPVADAPAIERLLAGVAASAIQLAAGDAPVGFCDAPSCGNFFAPSRSNQHWCSDACGTRARVARHAAHRRGK